MKKQYGEAKSLFKMVAAIHSTSQNKRCFHNSNLYIHQNYFTTGFMPSMSHDFGSVNLAVPATKKQCSS
jgi:hypothetical protein